MPVLMNATAYAARHGVGKSAVSNWKKQNLLVFAPDPDSPGKQLIDAEKSDLLIRGSIDPTRGRPKAAAPAAQASGETAQPVMVKAPAMSEMEKARLEEMQERTMRRQIERAQMIGQLVDLDEYATRVANMGRKTRERTVGLIRENAERLAAMTDPWEIVAWLGEKFDELFTRIANEIEAEADQEAAADAAMAKLETLEDQDDPEDVSD